MKNIMLYQHGGSYNHGCEALATTISKIITAAMEDSQIFLCSEYPEQDKKYNIATINKFFEYKPPIMRWTPKYFVYQLNKRIFKSRVLYDSLMKNKVCVNLSKKMDACIAIGGDNYCYNKGKNFWATDKAIKRKTKKMMLWGCSVEPHELEGELTEHLKNFDIITARESITYNALIKNGFADRAHLVADSAFLLEREYLPLPDCWKEGQMVGINLSPLVLDYTDNKEQVVQSIYAIIEYILKNTEMNVALIPHVRLDWADDIRVLLPIFEHFKDTKRIVLFDDIDLGCKQLKGYIARCRFFVGARTHAIIAAYSSCVPALALGYSVKARGIAEDIFGDSENLVLPVQTLDSPEKAVAGFKYLIKNELRLKEQLENTMPSYKERAKISGELLKELIK